MLRRRVAAHRSRPVYEQELWRALLAEWNNIPQDQLHNLIFSLPRCCIDCILSSVKYKMC